MTAENNNITNVSNTNNSNSSIATSKAVSGATTTKRRYRLAKKRTMPPRSNSTPLCLPENDNSSNNNNTKTSLLGSRVARFAYSESLQRRLIQGFLRQSSVEDVTSISKKKTVKDNDTVSITSMPTCTDLQSASSRKSAKTLSLSNIKSSSVPSIVRQPKSRDTKKEEANSYDGNGKSEFKIQNTNSEYDKNEKKNVARPRPKLASLSIEANITVSEQHSTGHSPPPTSFLGQVPAIMVNECSDTDNNSINQTVSINDDDQSRKFTDDFK